MPFRAKKKKQQARRRKATPRPRGGRARPWRWAGLAVCALLISGGAAWLAARASAAWPQFYRDVILGRGWFDLREVQILGSCRAMSKQELLERTGLRRGQNLITLDLTKVRQELEMIPYLESVAVEQVLPHLVRIHVTERLPVARVRVFQPTGRGEAAGRTWYVDRTGTVMPDRVLRSDPRDPFAEMELPTITGVNPPDVPVGSRVNDDAVDWALRTLELYRQVGMETIARIRTVDVSERGVLHLTLSTGTRVTLGPDDMQRQFLRLGLLHNVGRQNHKRLLEVDLSVRNNCPTLWTPLLSGNAIGTAATSPAN